MTADVVVIGAGITGCAAAYHLARKGATVLVVDKGDVGGEQSSRAWGFVRQQGRHPAELPLAREASRAWETLGAELDADLEFVRGGILVPASTPAEMRVVEAGVRTAKERGVGTHLLDPTQIQALVPELRGGWAGASYTAEDGHAEPGKATQAFAAAARRLGVQIRTRIAVEAIEVSGGRVTGLRAGGEFIGAAALVCAAGGGSAKLLEALGIPLPIRIARSTVCEVGPGSGMSTRIAMWGPKVAFRPTARGTFYLGNGYAVPGAVHDVTLASFRHLRHFLPSYAANWRRMKVSFGKAFVDDVFTRYRGKAPPEEPRVDAAKVEFNRRAFAGLFGPLGTLPLKRAWAGLMDLTPDMIPVLGPVRGIDGLHVAAGFSGHGFALAPAVGRVLAECVLDGHASLDLAPFDAWRFQRGRVSAAREVL